MGKVILLFVAMIAAVIPSRAEATGYAGVFAIKSLTIEGGIFIHADGIANPDGCTSSDMIAIPSNVPDREAIVSMAYTAIATGMRMSIWVNGCMHNVNRTVPVGYHFTLLR